MSKFFPTLRRKGGVPGVRGIQLSLLAGCLLVLFPAVSHAASLAYLSGLVYGIIDLITFGLLPLLVSLAVLLFLWGLIIFILRAGDDTGRVEGRQRMLWGILALFVLFALWSIVQIMQEIADVENGDAPVIPLTGP